MDRAQSKVDALVLWAVKNGADVDRRIKFTKYNGTNGIMAVLCGAESSNISLSIPHSLEISTESAREYLCIDPSVEPSNAMLKLALVLMRQDPQSFYRPYLECLPQSSKQINTLLSWSETERKILLKGTTLDFETNRRLRDLKREHANIIQMTNHPEVTFEDYLWAHSVLASRAFPYRLFKPDVPLDSMVLLPVIDLLNHRAKSHASWTVDERGFKLEPDVDPATAELVNNYGPKSNAELLLGYGFSYPANEFDHVVFMRKPSDFVDTADDESVVAYYKARLPEHPWLTFAKDVFVFRVHESVPDEMILLVATLCLRRHESSQPTLRSTLHAVSELRREFDTRKKMLPKEEVINRHLEQLQCETENKQLALNLIEGQSRVFSKASRQMKELENKILNSHKGDFVNTSKILKNDDTIRHDDNVMHEWLLNGKWRPSWMVDMDISCMEPENIIDKYGYLRPNKESEPVLVNPLAEFELA